MAVDTFPEPPLPPVSNNPIAKLQNVLTQIDLDEGKVRDFFVQAGVNWPEGMVIRANRINNNIRVHFEKDRRTLFSICPASHEIIWSDLNVAIAAVQPFLGVGLEVFDKTHQMMLSIRERAEKSVVYSRMQKTRFDYRAILERPDEKLQVSNGLLTMTSVPFNHEKSLEVLRLMMAENIVKVKLDGYCDEKWRTFFKGIIPLPSINTTNDGDHIEIPPQTHEFIERFFELSPHFESEYLRGFYDKPRRITISGPSRTKVSLNTAEGRIDFREIKIFLDLNILKGFDSDTQLSSLFTIADDGALAKIRPHGHEIFDVAIFSNHHSLVGVQGEKKAYILGKDGKMKRVSGIEEFEDVSLVTGLAREGDDDSLIWVSLNEGDEATLATNTITATGGFSSRNKEKTHHMADIEGGHFIAWPSEIEEDQPKLIETPRILGEGLILFQTNISRGQLNYNVDILYDQNTGIFCTLDNELLIFEKVQKVLGAGDVVYVQEVGTRNRVYKRNAKGKFEKTAYIDFIRDDSHGQSCVLFKENDDQDWEDPNIVRLIVD